MLSVTGTYDGFVASYSADGDHRWSRTIGGAGGDFAHGVAIAPDGDAVVVGTVTGTVDFGDGVQTMPSTAATEMFVAPLPPWLQRLAVTEPWTSGPDRRIRRSKRHRQIKATDKRTSMPQKAPAT